jgi:uncharacterized protein (DUF1778 family)
VTKRLQIRVDETELQEIERAARDRRMSVAEWVLATLRQARDVPAQKTVEEKVEAVRRAARHEFPTADIHQMLDEIERGDGEAKAS